MACDDVTLTLTADEALVLFDLLHKWEDDDKVGEPAFHAENVALWNLSCLLERELTDPFEPNYLALVAAARERLGPESQKLQ